jgi:hypothetical protein
MPEDGAGQAVPDAPDMDAGLQGHPVARQATEAMISPTSHSEVHPQDPLALLSMVLT